MTFAKRKEWYLEYEITVNRAGLLGDISSLLGMLGISIVTINGVDQGKGIVNQNRSTRKGRKVRTNCKKKLMK